ncbi:hypothetical protein GKIL_2362 [Gloeobacter kilaueensis JS1]|uniref:Uncharacterized protein n=1 Tax=Gloeobacter kilaueensis (strain ATCC BAA-2537 / CCAP 1431/1 / ULC 316 / JS1) TaxID=1183438 RepID=U5QI86_GLOK1|nr:hypothetical protein GKIL_2362 [Gloeobacter kilaueensis JS1]
MHGEHERVSIPSRGLDPLELHIQQHHPALLGYDRAAHNRAYPSPRGD